LLGELAEKELNPSEGLPETVNMSAEAFDAYYELWLLRRATGNEKLPEDGGLNDQPVYAMQTLLELDTLYNRILNDLRDSKKETEDGT